MTALCRQIVRNMFELDWRSLALFRMALATVILADLAVCSASLQALYTDDGVLPRAVLLENDTPMLSLHLAGGHRGFIGGLFAIEALLAALLLVGYRTTLATLGCWLLVLSRQARNPLVMFGPDMMLHIALFWAMFLPLGRRYSLDAALGRTQPPAETAYLGIAGFAYVVQFIVIYVMSAVLKTGDTWRVDFTAVYYSLSLEMYQQPLGAWLNQYNGVTRRLTESVIYLETYGPLLFVLPYWTGWGRLLGCLVFGLMQIGFGVCMKMGLFGPIMIAMMLVFLPDEFWRYLAQPLGSWLRRLTANWRPVRRLQLAKRLPLAAGSPDAPFVVDVAAPASARAATWRASVLPRLRDAMLLAALGYVLLSNLSDCSERAWRPSKLYWYARQTGLNQTFTMFAPDPQTVDGWFVLRGTLADGRSVNLFNGDSPADLTKPRSVADTYPDQRWCSYLLSLLDPGNRGYLDPFARYFGRQWNAAHGDAEQLTTVELIFMSKPTAADRTQQPVAEVLLWLVSYTNSA